MVQLGQVQSKEKWRKIKSFLRHFRRPPTKAELLFYILIVALVVAGALFFADRAEKKAEEKEARRIARMERLAELERERNKPFSPDEIQIPESEFSFYEQLANRSFHIEGEEAIGGAHYVEPKPKPKFELISEPSGYESVDTEIKNEFALELLSASESFQEPAPAPESGPRKKLQTGSFSSTFEANIHKSQLESLGYNPEVQKAVVNGKTIFRVKIGPFTTKDLAQVKRNLDMQQIKFIEVNP
ncbi:SPOR domain-containing protein [Ignatzschineria rhizosphaerae]|uniref:SPOR domain-containing protein n=1 Tax=Ignatzschineria rhizosphaerae TaxID=2923279 RepID=A0ABY3WZB1_9GAMM|nr:SPOR domain-containing protein [Ignatzschineria rhizosphaerae]UNM95979.1 SPOR domain-containing protein [Ignatzschineria rhizosphaerae]